MSMQSQIEEKLQHYFSPDCLEVVNESNKHHGHAGDDGSGESHFKVVMHGGNFKGASRLSKQREIYNALSEEMKAIHALSLNLK